MYIDQYIKEIMHSCSLIFYSALFPAMHVWKIDEVSKNVF